MKLTVLSENSSLSDTLQAEYGLSVYLEKGDLRLLFDVGTGGACIDNAKKLGIDLKQCTAIAFSHNHRDHCGGFLRLAREIGPECPVYVRHDFFRMKWWDHRCDAPGSETHEQALELVGPPMGPDFFFANGIGGLRVLVDDVVEIGENVYLVGNFPIPRGVEKVHPSSKMDGFNHRLTRDTFREEQVCVVKTAKGLVVLAGCAHNGICNIVATVRRRFGGERVCAVIGGTHLVPPNPKRIQKTVDFFQNSGMDCVGVCHCTGPVALRSFEKRVSAYQRTDTGFTYEIEDEESRP